MFSVEEFLKSRKLEHTYNKLVDSDLKLESIFELIYRDYDIGYEIVYGKKASSFWKLFKPEERLTILKRIYKDHYFQDNILSRFGFIFSDVSKDKKNEFLNVIFYDILSQSDRENKRYYLYYLSNLNEEERFNLISHNYKDIFNKDISIIQDYMFRVWYDGDADTIKRYMDFFKSDLNFFKYSAEYLYSACILMMFRKNYQDEDYGYFNQLILESVPYLGHDGIIKCITNSIKMSNYNILVRFILNKDKFDSKTLFYIIDTYKRKKDEKFVKFLNKSGNRDLMTLADYIIDKIDFEAITKRFDLEIPYPVVEKNFDGSNFDKIFADKVVMNEHYDKDAYVNLIKYLTKTNLNIFTSINMELMNPKYLDIFEERDEYGNRIYPSLRIIGKYPTLQNAILRLDDESLSIFKLIYKKLVRDDYDYSVILNTVLNSLADGQDELFNIIKGGYGNLGDDDKDKVIDSLIFVLAKGNSEFFKIESIDNLIDLKGHLKSMYSTIKDDYPSVYGLLNYFLISYYGMNINEARDLVQSFASDLDVDPRLLDEDDKKIISSLKALKSLIECKNLDLLRKKIVLQESLTDNKIDFNIAYLASFEAQTRRMFTKVLNKKLSDPEKMYRYDKLSDYVGVNVYDGFDEDNPEFYMLITALGAYTSFDRPDNYYDDWVRPNNSVHAFCGSLINNQMMGTARANYAVLGFRNVPESSLLLSAPYDIASSSANSLMDTAVRTRRKFLFPKKMIDYTRHTHNEVTLERLYKDGKLLPSYVLYLTESFIPDMPHAEDIPDSVAAVNQGLNSWKNSLQAAKDFNVPIVVINRSGVKHYEIEWINNKLDEFYDTKNPNLVYDILTRFENNRAGTRSYWNSYGFDPSDAKKIFSRMFAIIDGIKDKKQAEKCLMEMRRWLKDETTTKVGRKGIPVGDLELGIDCKKVSEKIKKRLAKLNKINMSWKDALDIIENQNIQAMNATQKLELIRKFGFNIEASDFDYLEKNQKGLIYLKDVLDEYSDLVSSFDDDIDRQRAYDSSLGVHGKNHIDDVMLYSLLMAQEAFKDRDDCISLVNMAVTAAKYHDCGRTDDGNSEHALKGAIKSYHILRDKKVFNKVELAAIYTAIFCHDLKGVSQDFETFCGKLFPDVLMAIEKGHEPNEKVNYSDADLVDTLKINKTNLNTMINLTKQITQIIRDSDALDRTRFITSSKAFTNQDMLSNEGKRYMNLAMRMSEFNALCDIQKYVKCGLISDAELMDMLSKPQKINNEIRAIKNPKELEKEVRYMLIKKQEESRKIKHEQETI